MPNIQYLMRRKLINSSPMTISSFWFLLFILSCSSLFGFNIGIGTLKLSQIVFFVYCFFSLYIFSHVRKAISIIDKYTAVVLLVILAYGLFSITYSVDRRLTANILVQLFLNIVIFYVVIIGFTIRPNFYKKFTNRLIIVFWLLFICTIIHYILSFFIPSLRVLTDGALMGGIKPSLFFGESNWHSNYMFFIYYAIYLQYRNEDVSQKSMRRVLIGMFVLLLFTLSRIMMVVFLIHYFFYYHKRSKVWLIIIFTGLTLTYYSPLPKLVLPERYTYDLYDTDVNPRYLDSYFLINQVSKYNKEKVGFGMGTLAYSNDDIWLSSRANDFEYGTSINVMPVQIYYDFGIVGLSFFCLLFLFSLFRISSDESKFIIIAAIVLCCFHMPGYMNFFWLFLGYFYFLINIRPIQKRYCVDLY